MLALQRKLASTVKQESKATVQKEIDELTKKFEDSQKPKIKKTPEQKQRDKARAYLMDSLNFQGMLCMVYPDYVETGNEDSLYGAVGETIIDAMINFKN